MSSSTQLSPSKAISSFKTPPSPSKLSGLSKRTHHRKAKVLDEEEYVEKVSQIIERDFFPELEKFEAQSEYLDASDRNDIATMSRLRERFSTSTRVRHQNRTGSPETFETPQEERREEIILESNQHQEEKKKFTKEEDLESNLDEKKKVSLDQFMSNHTSEDNASYEEIMEESQKRFMLEKSWMFKEDEIKSLEDKRQQLELPSIERQNELASKDIGQSKKVDGWTYKNVNPIFYHPDAVPLSDEQEIEQAKKEKQIVIENTRFQKNPWKTNLQDDSVKVNAYNKQEKEAGKFGVDGKESGRPETPAVNGFKFLRMTPSPMPGAASETPMMTWGEVESTPYRLEGCDTPLPMNTTGGPSFSIQQVPKRDRLAYELAEKNSKFYRDKKGKAIQKARSNIKTPKMNLTTRVATMSPAAQRLATNKLGIRIGTDKALKASYTPSPRRPTSIATPKSNVRNQIMSSIRSRGSATPKNALTPIHSDVTTLTDNLLNLPKSVSKDNRPRAADFL